jgi:cephalosporin-C deacetylase
MTVCFDRKSDRKREIMPQVDLPIEQLLEYQGRNPKPADFDPFWDKALAEMNAVDADVELQVHSIDADFAECFELRFTGVGGARVFAKYVRPAKTNGPVPCVLQFHGYGGASEQEWSNLLSWAARGYAVASLDCRGQGGKSEDVGGVKGNTQNGLIIRGLDDSPEKLYFRSVFLDTAQLAKVVASFDEVDGNRLGAMGGSQGGALTLACAALAPIKRAAPVFPFLSDYQRVWEMDLAVGAYAELKSFFRQFDPRHERENAIFERLGYIDIQHLMPRVIGEVLMAVGLMDTICPPSTQFAAFNKISTPKNYVLYPDFGHEGLPGFADLTWKFMGGL